MTFAELQAQLSELMTEMQNEPEDPHELYMQIRERLAEMRAYGMPLPEDLLQLEAALEAEFGEAAAGGGDEPPG